MEFHENKAILITTAHRGVFFGLVPEDTDLNQRTLALKNARCAIYWGTEGGVAELAHKGPNGSSRIGSPADIEAIHDVTAVFTVTHEARDRWLSA